MSLAQRLNPIPSPKPNSTPKIQTLKPTPRPKLYYEAFVVFVALVDILCVSNARLDKATKPGAEENSIAAAVRAWVEVTRERSKLS